MHVLVQVLNLLSAELEIDLPAVPHVGETLILKEDLPKPGNTMRPVDEFAHRFLIVGVQHTPGDQCPAILRALVRSEVPTFMKAADFEVIGAYDQHPQSNIRRR